MIEEGHICYLHEVSIFLYIILKIYNQSISSSKTKNFVMLTIIRPIYSRISEFTENSVIYFFILLTVPHLQQFIDIRNIPTYTLILIPNSRQMKLRQSQWDINNLHPRNVDTRFMTDTAKNIFGKIYAHEGIDDKPENYPINIVHLFDLNDYKLLIMCQLRITQIDMASDTEDALCKVINYINKYIEYYKDIYVMGDYNKSESDIRELFDNIMTEKITKLELVLYYSICESQIGMPDCTYGIIHIDNQNYYRKKYIKYKNKYLITKNNKLR